MGAGHSVYEPCGCVHNGSVGRDVNYIIVFIVKAKFCRVTRVMWCYEIINRRKLLIF